MLRQAFKKGRPQKNPRCGKGVKLSGAYSQLNLNLEWTKSHFYSLNINIFLSNSSLKKTNDFTFLMWWGGGVLFCCHPLCTYACWLILFKEAYDCKNKGVPPLQNNIKKKFTGIQIKMLYCIINMLF